MTTHKTTASALRDQLHSVQSELAHVGITHAMIPIVKDGAEIVLAHQMVKDGTQKRHYDYELLHLDHDQATGILANLIRGSRSIDAACASLIVDWLTSDKRTEGAAKDEKPSAWSEIKRDCEKYIYTHDGLPAGRLASVQQWQNFFSVAKKAIALGFPIVGLMYPAKEGGTAVVSRSMLLAFIKDNKPASDKVFTAQEQLTAIAERLDGGKDGDGETLVGEVKLDHRSASVLAEIGLSNMAVADVQEVVVQAFGGPAAAIKVLVDQYGLDAVGAAWLQFMPEQKAA